MKAELLLLGAGQWILDWCEYYELAYTLIEKAERYSPSTARQVILLDYENDASLWDYVEALCESRNIVACITSNETALEIAEEINQRFKLAYSSCGNQYMLRDKYAMRAALAAAGMNNVEFTLAQDSKALQAFLLQWKDVIAKPRYGFASANIRRIESPNQAIPAHIEYPVLAEKFIGGQEYSVEAFSFDGTHRILGVTEKTVHPHTFVEKRHVFPAALDAAEQQLIEKSVIEFLNFTHMRNGPSHTELKVFEGKAHIIEGHNRAAGDAIAGLIEMVTGINVYQQLVAWAGLQQNLLPKTIPYARVAMIDFLFTEEGVVRSISGEQSSLAIAGVVELKLYYKAGDRVEQTQSSYNRFGHVIVNADSAAQCERVLAEVYSRLKIIMSPG